MSKLLMAIIISLLIAGLVFSGVAAYQGYGITQVGEHHLRQDSVGGPSVLGGGPGSGK